MKKTLLMALMASASVFAGTPATIAPVPAEPAETSMTCPIFELGAFYGFAGRDIIGDSDTKINMIGGDITAVWSLDHAQSLNIRFGYGFGDKAVKNYDDFGDWDRGEIDVHTFFLMPGYRYTGEISEKARWYVGVNAGVANMSAKYENSYSDYPSWRDHDSAFGFAYSAELGLRYEITETIEVFAGYQFFGHTAAPGINDGDGIEKYNKQNYHMIRMGVGFAF